jgi:hypothetical protein
VKKGRAQRRDSVCSDSGRASEVTRTTIEGAGTSVGETGEKLVIDVKKEQASSTGEMGKVAGDGRRT